MSERHSEAVWAAFLNPHHAAPPEPGQRIGRAHEPLTGTWVQLHASVVEGRVERLSFLARACPATIAVLDGFCHEARGQAIDSVHVEARDWLQRLAIPTDRLTRVLLIDDAWRRIQAQR